MSGGYPDAPEAVALELMRMIETAEEKSGRRDQRSNLTERVRLLDLFKDCISAVTRDGLHRPASGASTLSMPRLYSPARRNPGGVFLAGNGAGRG
jgi:hypothetical protein